MKKLTTLFLSVMSTALIAQIPNASFENWTSGTPDGWTVLSFASGDVTESNTAQAGSHSISLNSVLFSSYYEGGIVETGTASNTYYPATGNPPAVTGWYQLTASGGDFLNITAVAKHMDTTCGAGNDEITANSTVWKQFSVCVTYTKAMDSMWLSIGLENSGGQTNAGSVALVDDLSYGACISGVDEISHNVTLEPAYPNPASNQCNIIYSIPSTGTVSVALYDISGRKVMNLLGNTTQTIGRYKIPVDVTGLANGMYIYRVTVDGQTYSQKLTVAK